MKVVGTYSGWRQRSHVDDGDVLFIKDDYTYYFHTVFPPNTGEPVIPEFNTTIELIESNNRSNMHLIWYRMEVWE